MTLFKQIVIILSFFQTIIFGIVLWQNFNTVSEFVETQLSIDARHTANSLGLSITPAASEDDLIMIETMINSMFDSGYYELISLKSTNGKVLVEAKQAIKIADVPQWFVSLFTLSAPMAQSNIMAGWTQYGTLYVKNNVGVAYRQLWYTFKDITLTFAFVTLLAFLILYLSLKFILKPLKKVQEQAKAITGNDFIFQRDLPKTIELKQVVSAMNSMVSKVKEIFDKEAETVKKYHTLLYEDPEMRLFNRRYFTLKLKEYLASDEVYYGSVVFINFVNHKKIKSEIGFEKTEKLRSEISDYFRGINIQYKHAVISRMKEGDFAFLLPNCKCDKAHEMCSILSENLNKLLSVYKLDTNDCYFNFGIINYDKNNTISDIFAKADFALTTAKSKGKFEINVNLDDEEEITLGKEAWKSEIINAMEEKRFIFAMQKVISKDSELYHNEIFLRLEDKQGQIKNAAYFMPMVNELELNEEVDKYVLENIFNSLEHETFLSSPLSINLGKEILLNAQSLAWFEDKLDVIKSKIAYPINFEISHRYKLPIPVLANFSRLLKKHNFGFGLDSFTLDGDSLKILQDISPTYIKIPALSILDLLGDKNAEYSKQSLDIITSSMNIKVIAFAIQDEKEKDKLLEMGISYMQGDFIQKPYLC